jgi:sulfate adenylyltransferase
MIDLALDRGQYLEFEKLAIGAYAPLAGFMTGDQFDAVVETLRLPGGEPFPLPVCLEVDPGLAVKDRIGLGYQGRQVGWMYPDQLFQRNRELAAEKVFGCRDLAHPGVRQFLGGSGLCLGGRVELVERAPCPFPDQELTPEATRALFRHQGWKTVAGFQTRNVPHKAHEYLLRLALEWCDGLFVQPLVGWKKKGDYAPEAVIKAYQTLISGFLPRERVRLGVFSAAMRYAGPREAVFHALVRRNYGCTHFIVGRDHAGVGGYYGKYAAQELALSFSDLGITILPFPGPFYCERCAMIATERTCAHDPGQVHEISGTMIRATLAEGLACDPRFIRPEIVRCLDGMEVFIAEDEHEPR